MQLLLRVESAKRILMLVRFVPVVKGYKYFVVHTRAYKLRSTLSATYYANYQVEIVGKVELKFLLNEESARYFIITLLC